MSDRAYPMGFLVVTIFASGMLWVFAMLSALPIR